MKLLKIKCDHCDKTVLSVPLEVIEDNVTFEHECASRVLAVSQTLPKFTVEVFLEDKE